MEEINAANKAAAGILSKEDGLEEKVEQEIVRKQEQSQENDVPSDEKS